MAAKNLCAKTVTPDQAYEVWQSIDGFWTWYVLKKYQTPENEAKNLYARWLCKVVTPIVPDGEYGDVYVSEIKEYAHKLDYNPLARNIPQAAVPIFPQENETCVMCGDPATWCLLGFHYCDGYLPTGEETAGEEHNVWNS